MSTPKFTIDEYITIMGALQNSLHRYRQNIRESSDDQERTYWTSATTELTTAMRKMQLLSPIARS